MYLHIYSLYEFPEDLSQNNNIFFLKKRIRKAIHISWAYPNIITHDQSPFNRLRSIIKNYPLLTTIKFLGCLFTRISFCLALDT